MNDDDLSVFFGIANGIAISLVCALIGFAVWLA